MNVYAYQLNIGHIIKCHDGNLLITNIECFIERNSALVYKITCRVLNTSLHIISFMDYNQFDVVNIVDVVEFLANDPSEGPLFD
jgi:hypothetical protein